MEGEPSLLLGKVNPDQLASSRMLTEATSSAVGSSNPVLDD